MVKPKRTAGDKSTAAKTPSPIRKNVFKKKIKTKDKPKNTIELRCVSSNGTLIIWAEGYFWTIIKDIESGAYQDPLMYGKVGRRVSQEDNSHLLNEAGWWKVAIIRNKSDNDDDDTHEYRMQVLNEIKDYLQNHADNRFNTYVVNEETADETPEGDPLPLDHYIVDGDIIDYVKAMHDIEDNDPTWARTNKIESAFYFSGPTYPHLAKQVLGYSDVA